MTLEMKELKNAAFLRILAALGVISNLQVTCPLLTIPLRDVLLKVTAMEPKRSNQLYMASLVIALAAMLAISLEGHFASACSLIGAVCTFTDSIILPIVFYHQILPKDSHNFKIFLWHSIVMVIAISCFSGGLVNSICDMAPSLALCTYLSH